MSATLRRKLLFIPALGIGVLLLFLLINNRLQPVQTEYSEVATVVRTIEVPSTTVRPSYLGFGTVSPSTVWNGIAQVSGKVIAVDPTFKNGNIVPADQFLLQIDPTDYELAVAQVETNIEALQAQLAELEIQEKNSTASLQIERESLEISRAELARRQNLVSQGAASSSEVEKEQRNVLAQSQSVQTLENTIRVYPAERRRLQAELARLQTQLDGAILDLDRTRVTVPFNARIAEVEVEQFQYVRQGDRLGSADAIARAEIEVQVPLWRVVALIRSEGITDVTELNSRSIGERLGMTARVFLERDALYVDWDGRVARFSDAVDPQTRTVGIIVEVDEPYSDVRPGIRPPLVKGMFVSVELIGRPRPDTLLIPRSALRGQEVFLVNAQGRLESRMVSIGITGPDYFSVTQGLQEGDRIVVSDLVPAIEGMLLEPRDDPDTLSRLLAVSEELAEAVQ